MNRLGETGLKLFNRMGEASPLQILIGLYADCFGFTKQEVAESLVYFELEGSAEDVETWYDGFLFGKDTAIYNPWSILNACHGLFENYTNH